MKANFYQFTAKNIKGEQVSMESFRGKTVMVVNTASKCGLASQLKGLEDLYTKYKDRGLVVLGFPCNQFANQEPGDEKSISEGCVLYYDVNFPMFAKVEVNGENAHPLYKYLKSELPGFLSSKIKWNFTKFVVNGEGKPIKRFSPTTTPEKIDKYLEKVLY